MIKVKKIDNPNDYYEIINIVILQFGKSLTSYLLPHFSDLIHSSARCGHVLMLSADFLKP